MDVDLAPSVAATLAEALNRSDTGYAPTSPDLGESLSGFASRRWTWDVDPESVVALPDVGVGAVELLRVIASPGDAVVISSPVYPPFFRWVSEAGAALIDVPLTHDHAGWRLDLDRVEAAFAQHPAAYILCNPHNPVGRTHSPEELAALASLADHFGVTIISDEIHAPLVSPGGRFTPMLTVPGGCDVAISLLSASKAFNLAGLKCAAAVTGSPVMRAVTDRLPEELRWRFGHLGLLATIAALRTGDDWLDRLILTLDRRRDHLGRLLSEYLPSIEWIPPAATYLAWLDCRKLGPGSTGRDMFLERGRVALEPGPRFGPPGSGFARLNFATSADILEEGVHRMAAALR